MKLSKVFLIVNHLIWKELQNTERDCVLPIDIWKGNRCIAPVCGDRIIYAYWVHILSYILFSTDPLHVGSAWM